MTLNEFTDILRHAKEYEAGNDWHDEKAARRKLETIVHRYHERKLILELFEVQKLLDINKDCQAYNYISKRILDAQI